jgi:hypothetical protein
MADTQRGRKIPRYVVLTGGVIVAILVVLGVASAVQDRRDKALATEIERTQFELLGLGGQITAIKDADLTTTNDYIAAFAQIEPIQKEYDEKLQKFSDLYSYARERDSHRGLIDIQRLRGKHHPETWDRMSEIIALVRQINDITKRESSVVHAMVGLPDAERPKFWHEQFLPLAAQEHALREKLVIVGQGKPPTPSIQ